MATETDQQQDLLHPEGVVHRNLLTLLNSCYRLGEKYMSQRYQQWDKCEQMDQAYIDLTRTDRKGKKAHPFETTVYIPVSRAAKDTIITYWMGVFTRKRPMFSISGRGPEDVAPAKRMEVVIDYQLERQRAQLTLWSFLNNILRFSFGHIKNLWGQDIQTIMEAGRRYNPAPFPHFEEYEEEKEIVSYEGPMPTCSDPYYTFFDPRVTTARFQNGQFVIYEYERSMYYLKKQRAAGHYINIEHLEKRYDSLKSSMAYDGADSEGNYFRSNRSTRRPSMSLSTDAEKNLDEKNPHFTVREYYVELIPQQYGLGEANYPQHWVFTVVGNQLIIRAERSVYGSQFPAVQGEFDFDPHTLFSQSFYEGIEGMQDLLNWIYNCFDPATEVLTSKGWVPIAGVTDETEVATVDPDNGSLWFEKPEKLFEYDFNGDMVKVDQKRVDLLVTPNHKLFGKFRGVQDREFIEASELLAINGREFKFNGMPSYKGFEPEPMVFDELVPVRERGKQRKYQRVEVDPLAWSRFIGWFVSEGSITKGEASGSHGCAFAQNEGAKADILAKDLAALGFHVTEYSSNGVRRFTITDKRLFEQLAEQCYTDVEHCSFTKRIPQAIKTWKVEFLRALLDTAILGDGWRIRENLLRYVTTSRQLADDIQEIAVKCSYAATIYTEQHTNGYPVYRVNINTNNPGPTIAKSNVSKEPYRGKVYCFQNSTHLTVVRRNGKVCVCGQSHMDNVRRFLNDSILFNQRAIELRDITKPHPAKVIRLTKEFAELQLKTGMPISNFIQQLQVADVTSSHLKDAEIIVDLIQRRSHASDAMQGIESEVKRTATEIARVANSGSNILGQMAMLIYAQALIPMVEQAVINNQRFLSEERYYRIIGDYAKDILTPDPNYVGGNAVLIGRDKLQGYFDYPVNDGRLPMLPEEQAETWLKCLEIMGKVPPVTAQYDAAMVFREFVRSMGIKNIDDFKIRAQVVPNDLLSALAQRGNAVPIPGSGAPPPPPAASPQAIPGVQQ